MELRNATFLILRPKGNKFDNSVICFPFLRQFGALDVFFPGAPACTWNCMAPLLSFSPSIWHPWRFLPWSPCLHLTWNCMAPLSSFYPSIWRPWRFLPYSPCLHLKLHGAPLVLLSVNWRSWRFLPWGPCLHLKLHKAPVALFSVNLAPKTFSSLEPLLAFETAWRPSCHIDLPFVLSFFFLIPFFFLFSLIFSFFFSFFLLSPLFLSVPFLFLSFWLPFDDPEGPGPPKAPKIRPWLYIHLIDTLLADSVVFVIWGN